MLPPAAWGNLSVPCLVGSAIATRRTDPDWLHHAVQSWEKHFPSLNFPTLFICKAPQRSLGMATQETDSAGAERDGAPSL